MNILKILLKINKYFKAKSISMYLEGMYCVFDLIKYYTILNKNTLNICL